MISLSIRNPWAAAILVGGKDVENRSRYRNWGTPRGRILIHCGKQPDQLAIDAGLCRGVDLADERGMLLGTVDWYRTERSEECQLQWCDQIPGFAALLLRDPLIFREPIPWTGRLGLFQVDDDAVAAAIASAETPADRASRLFDERHHRGALGYFRPHPADAD